MKQTKSEKQPKATKSPLPKYEPPRMVTLNKAAILEELGPARACYLFAGAVVGC